MRATCLMILGFWVGMSGAFSSHAYAVKQTPMKLLQETQKKVEAIINTNIKAGNKKAQAKREKDVQRLVEPFFDFDLLAQKTLSKHWKGLKQEQKKRFVFWFKELLMQAYIKGARAGQKQRNNQKHTLQYKKETIKGKTAKVFTLIRYQVIRRKRKRWKRTYVDWTFIKQKTGWKVTDIITNDNSMMEVYQEKFDDTIRKKSFAALVKIIKRSTLKLRKKHGLSPIKFRASQTPASKSKK